MKSKEQEQIKKQYNSAVEKYLSLRREADKQKDIAQRLSGLVEYEQ